MRRTVAFIALRLCVIAACTLGVAFGAVLIGETLLPKPGSSSDWGFGRLSAELWGGGASGLVLGLVLALRLGRRRFDGVTRALQTVAALALPALLMLGQCMESG